MLNIQIYNKEDKSLRWDLGIIQQKDGMYKVEELTAYSLFNSGNWETGKTPGEALDNFLKIEQQLIDRL